jgi:hypothetical protein
MPQTVWVPALFATLSFAGVAEAEDGSSPVHGEIIGDSEGEIPLCGRHGLRKILIGM